MNKFLNFGRLCRLARLQLTLNYRRILLFGLGYILLIMTIYLMFNLSYISGAREVADIGMFHAGRAMSCMLTFFLFVYVISCSFRPYFRRGFAAANMMLPATRCEKFTMALVPPLVIAPILLCVITLANDSLWLGILGPLNSAYYEATATGNVEVLIPVKSLLSEIMELNRFEYLVESNMEDKIASTRIAILMMMLLPTTVFFMFSSIYRRLTLLLSIISIGLCNIVIVSLLQFATFQTIEDNAQITSKILSGNDGYNVVLIVMSLIALYIAWHRFSRLQINK